MDVSSIGESSNNGTLTDIFKSAKAAANGYSPNTATTQGADQLLVSLRLSSALCARDVETFDPVDGHLTMAMVGNRAIPKGLPTDSHNHEIIYSQLAAAMQQYSLAIQVQKLAAADLKKKQTSQSSGLAKSELPFPQLGVSCQRLHQVRAMCHWKTMDRNCVCQSAEVKSNAREMWGCFLRRARIPSRVMKTFPCKECGNNRHVRCIRFPPTTFECEYVSVTLAL